MSKPRPPKIDNHPLRRPPRILTTYSDSITIICDSITHSQSNQPNQNFDGAQYNKAGWDPNEGGFSYHNFQKYDLSSIPAGVTFGTPELQIKVFYNSGFVASPAYEIELYIRRFNPPNLFWDSLSCTWLDRFVDYGDPPLSALWLTPGGDWGTDKKDKYAILIQGTNWQEFGGNALSPLVKWINDAFADDQILRLGITPRVASGGRMEVQVYSRWWEDLGYDFSPRLIIPYTYEG